MDVTMATPSMQVSYITFNFLKTTAFKKKSFKSDIWLIFLKIAGIYNCISGVVQV